jgi:hypothetical protein|tara:strand:+ start:1895 stop:3001 length:1107 start_codon:yes stop_codon:yes gene_type:complete
MKIKLSLLILFTTYLSSQENLKNFMAPEGNILIGADLHTHTVFSDGMVWPSIRTEEAQREGFELIAITDHLEYQPHREDIPNPDFNRSYQIAKESVGGGDLIVLPGSEITRNMPPGHFNAIFIKDANKLLFENDSVAGIYEANKQGAFVFWNHPHWTSNSQGRMDGIAKLDPVHKNLIKENLIHGIEVANELTFSEEAFEIALENNLTILGTSDIHGISDWLFEIPEGGHRPLTYILSNDLKQNSIKKALFMGNTFVWFEDLIAGKEEILSSIIASNFKVESKGYTGDTALLEISLTNLSSLPLKLKYIGDYTFHQYSDFLEVPAKNTVTVQVKTVKRIESLMMKFEILNAIIGRKKNLHATYNLNIQ